jgi:hypothetical protein
LQSRSRLIFLPYFLKSFLCYSFVGLRSFHRSNEHLKYKFTSVKDILKF